MSLRMYSLLLTLICAAFVLSACKSDKKITGPDDPNPGAFRLVMMSEDTLRYNIENTITIRLFRGSEMAVNDTLVLRTESGIGYLDDPLVIPQSDTINVNGGCGANPCVGYICQDTTVAKDAVFGYAISNGDTVATASVGFFLKH